MARKPTAGPASNPELLILSSLADGPKHGWAIMRDIEAFAEAGVETIRLWPRWLEDRSLVARVRKMSTGLLIGAGNGKKDEVLPLLTLEPSMLSSEDPEQLQKTLTELLKSRR